MGIDVLDAALANEETKGKQQLRALSRLEVRFVHRGALDDGPTKILCACNHSLYVKVLEVTQSPPSGGTRILAKRQRSASQSAGDRLERTGAA